MESKDNSLEGDDKESEHWRQMLDLESAAKMKSDWYSTRTFELFLDALDINQPVVTEDKNNSPEMASDRGILKGISSKKFEAKEGSLSEKPAQIICDQKFKQHQNVETILSAEALKILSELPDLSHMSATRSFIFPNQVGPQRRKL